ncbi:hypothetical protein QO200_03350 [Flavobacterium sp. Arc3]|jgi:hypothetical protein|uniref:hypothetical protein n=1 Tax=unclassified Flavobacterium TaxID=196869 RepID=UPI00352C0CB1
MKKSALLSVITILLFTHLAVAQQLEHQTAVPDYSKTLLLEGGLNLSLPVHIQMYRTHRVGVGINIRASKKISPKTELGIRGEYDYRFVRNIGSDTTGTAEGRALHKNFSLFALKPNVQFSFGRNWFLGAETGVGFAISDENNRIGLGFISEYNGEAQFGSCSGIYLGKYFITGTNDRKLGISLNLTNFIAKGHAENTLGLKFNYCFLK